MLLTRPATDTTIAAAVVVIVVVVTEVRWAMRSFAIASTTVTSAWKARLEDQRSQVAEHFQRVRLVLVRQSSMHFLRFLLLSSNPPNSPPTFSLSVQFTLALCLSLSAPTGCKKKKKNKGNEGRGGRAGCRCGAIDRQVARLTFDASVTNE